MDTFQVEPLNGDAVMDSEKLEQMSRDMAAVLEGTIDLNQLLTRRAPLSSMHQDRQPTMRAGVKIDNRASDFFSIVEVRGRDRVGLLFVLTRTLAELNLDIHLALINTQQGQVFDVFYVQDATGQKLWDDERLALLDRELYLALEQMEDTNQTCRL